VLRRIVRHESRLLASDRLAVVVALLFGVMLVAAAANGASWALTQSTGRATLAAEQDQRYTKARAEVAAAAVTAAAAAAEPAWGPANPSYLGSFVGRYVAQAPAPLAALAVGQSDLYTGYSKVNARTREAFVAGDQTENPLLLKVGQFDLAFALLYLYPLFVLALCYDLTSGERDDGTLRLVVSQPVALGTVVVGKLLARAAVVLAPAAIAPLLALWFVGQPLDADALTRLATWTVAVAAYGLLWFALAVAVNAAGRSPEWNALTLSGLWLILVVMSPAAINAVVSAWYPVPSRVEFVNAARAATDEARVEGSRVLGRFIEEHPEFSVAGDAMKNASVLQAARDDEIARMVAPVVTRFESQLARQHAAVAVLRFLSPAALLQSVLVDAAGTGFERYRHFFAQVDVYHRTWREYFQPLLFANTSLTPAVYDRLPAFIYSEERVGAVVARTALPVLGLTAAGLLLLVVGLRRFRAYPVAAG